jgi:Na+-driven multidrug efflux pump
MNIYASMFTLYIGASIAAGILVGKSVGENNIPVARRFGFVAELCIVTMTTTLSIFLFIFRKSITAMFSSDATIQAIALPAMTVLAMVLIPDSLIFA